MVYHCCIICREKCRNCIISYLIVPSLACHTELWHGKHLHQNNAIRFTNGTCMLAIPGITKLSQQINAPSLGYTCYMHIYIQRHSQLHRVHGINTCSTIMWNFKWYILTLQNSGIMQYMYAPTCTSINIINLFSSTWHNYPYHQTTSQLKIETTLGNLVLWPWSSQS